MGLFKKLFRFVENSSDIPTINDATNQFVVDKEKKQLIVDIGGERITLGDISSLTAENQALRTEIENLKGILNFQVNKINTNFDCNDMTTPGFWPYLISAAQPNGPGYWGYMMILKYVSSSGIENITQVLFSYYYNNNIIPQAGFLRYRMEDEWTDWKAF